MWFGKNIMTKLGLVLAMAVPAFAAPVFPLYFEDVNVGTTRNADGSYSKEDSVKQQDEWEYLMKYKMFGARGIEFKGQIISIPDSSGWFGTADGDFVISGNIRHRVGGPILIGGNMSFYDGYDTLSTGPIRITGNVDAGSNFGSKVGDDKIALTEDDENVFNGDQCIKGSISENYRKFIRGTLFTGNGSDDYSYSKCPDTIPQVKESLRIPLFDDSKLSYGPKVVAGDNGLTQNAYIDIPPGQAGDVFDTLIQKIEIHASNKVLVRMPKGGRLTRIFLEEGVWIENSGMIQIMYMDGNDAKFDEKNNVWTGSGSIVENKDYAGNLLLYTNEPIAFPARDVTDTLQGSYITTSSITIEQQMTLAGQLLANTISINAKFDGSGFLYVPFDPDTLDIDPTALSGGKFPENDQDALVPIRLDSPAHTNVSFKYCFDFSKTGEGYAEAADFNKTEKSKMPDCGKSEYEIVYINEKDTEPTNATKVYINVKKEVPSKKEVDEKLYLYVFSLNGAIMADNKREGTFELIIADMDGPEFDDDNDHYDVNEYPDPEKLVAIIPIKNVDVNDEDAFNELVLEVENNNVDATKPGFDAFFEANLVRDVDAGKVYAKITVLDKTLIDYETILHSFEIKLILKDQHGITRKINIIDVNEPPYFTKEGPFEVEENSEPGVTVDTVKAEDPDVATKFNTLTYSILDKDVPFVINPQTGVIKVAEGAELDHETVPQYDINVQVTDGANPIKTVVTIVVTDENEPPIRTVIKLQKLLRKVRRLRATKSLVTGLKMSMPKMPISQRTWLFRSRITVL